MDSFSVVRSEAVALPTWIDRAAYPFNPESFVTTDGTMRFVDEGEGLPVLLVHGTPSWSFEWRTIISGLRGEARCIAPDHLGFGLSDKPPLAPYAPADHARRLLALVRHLDLRDLTLVLHDFGGPIGLPVLLDEPSRVRSIVLVNTWAWPHGQDRRVARVSRIIQSPFGRWLYQRWNASPRWLLPSVFGQRSKLTRAIHRHYLAPFPNPQSRRSLWVLGCELAGSDPYYAQLWARHGRLEPRPVSIVWGLSDPAFGPSYLETWKTALPHASITALPNVGHFPQEEAPDEVIQVIRAALPSTSASDSTVKAVRPSS